MSAPGQQRPSEEDRLFEDMAKMRQPMAPDAPGIEQLPRCEAIDLADYYTPEELADDSNFEFDPEVFEEDGAPRLTLLSMCDGDEKKADAMEKMLDGGA